MGCAHMCAVRVCLCALSVLTKQWQQQKWKKWKKQKKSYDKEIASERKQRIKNEEKKSETRYGDIDGDVAMV